MIYNLTKVVMIFSYFIKFDTYPYFCIQVSSLSNYVLTYADLNKDLMGTIRCRCPKMLFGSRDPLLSVSGPTNFRSHSSPGPGPISILSVGRGIHADRSDTSWHLMRYFGRSYIAIAGTGHFSGCPTTGHHPGLVQDSTHTHAHPIFTFP